MNTSSATTHLSEAQLSETELSSFCDFLRFPSVSASPEHRADTQACAEWLAGRLTEWGFAASLEPVSTAPEAPPAPPPAPVVVARSPHLPGRPTLLLYGHYDVQPAEPLDLWESPPFEPTVRDGFLYARGATDNKGQTFSLLLGVQRCLARGSLPVNLLVVAEGEEEIGSPNFGAFLMENASRLGCDAALIADTSMIAPGHPALTLGLRGILCLEVTAHGPARDLHSGMFGGAAPNPALALCRVLGRLHQADGSISIPNFYDGILPVSAPEKAAWARLPWDEEWFTQATGIRPTAGERDRTVLERVWARPTAEINGMASGHQGHGSKTIIPSRATAKLSFRLVPGQNSETIAPLVKEWLERELAGEGVRGEVWIDHGGEPFFLPPENPFVQAAAASIEAVFGVPPALTREGLSIPAALLLHRHLGVPVVLLGLGLPDCQAHAPNESYPLAHLDLGAAFLQDYLQRLGKMD